LCGYILDDPLVMVPNMFSTCCAGSSVALKIIYPSDFCEKSVEDGTPANLDVPIKVRKEQNEILKAAPTEFSPLTKPSDVNIIKKLTAATATSAGKAKMSPVIPHVAAEVSAVGGGAGGTGETC